MKLWLNGQFVDSNKACIAPNDRGFLLGDGLFETMLWHNKTIVGFAGHMDRLRLGAKTLELPITLSNSQIEDVAKDLILSNNLLNDRASLRLTISRGSGTRGLLLPETTKPTYMMTVGSYTAPPQHVSAIVSQIRRNDLSPLSNLKTLNYLDNILAKQEAHSAGFDEAIMLNTKDRIACASAANLFIVENGKIVTPPLKEGVLPGVTRAMIINIANEEQIPCLEQPIDGKRLVNADEIFLTNSLIGVGTVTSLADKTFDTHPMTTRLRTFYENGLSF